jgi:hypothetical protein
MTCAQETMTSKELMAQLEPNQAGALHRHLIRAPPVISSKLVLYAIWRRHYYRKTYARHFENSLRGGQAFEPPRLMPGINRGGHFY